MFITIIEHTANVPVDAGESSSVDTCCFFQGGIMPLHLACFGRQDDTVRLLLKYRADVNVQTTKVL